MAIFEIDANEIEVLHQAIKKFPGNAEGIINSVLHEDGSELIQHGIRMIMPVSDPAKVWAGKLPHAKLSKSLTDEKGNLSITVKATKKYYYLCFPDGGTSVQDAQEFFLRGGESQQTEIINRCLYMIRRRLGS